MSWHFSDRGGKWRIRHHGDSLLAANDVGIIPWAPL